MPPKKAPKFKKPRLGRAGRTAADKKNSQKLKQTQRVTVNITSGGGGGGSTAPMPFIPQPFRDTSGENVQLMNFIKSVSANMNRGNVLGRAPAPEFVAPEVVPNPANDSATTSAVFNAPITYNDDLAEEVLREIDQLNIKPKPIAKPPAIFNTPNENNSSLMERIRKVERGYEEAQAFNTPVRPRAESAPPDIGESSANPFVGTPTEPYFNRNGKWRSDVKRSDLERLAQDYGLPVTGQTDDKGREVKLTKEQLKNILNVRLGL